jgi:hypothetical protein
MPETADERRLRLLQERLNAAVAAAQKALVDAGPEATRAQREDVEELDRSARSARAKLWAPLADDLVTDIEARSAATVKEIADAKRKKEETAQKRDEATRALAEWHAVLARCQTEWLACKKECEANVASYACQAVAIGYQTGVAALTPKPDLAKALKIARDGCAAGQKLGCATAGGMEKSAAACDDLDACKPYCDGGFGSACTHAGEFHRDGTGTKKDLGRAAALFTRACSLDDADGCNDLGAAQFEGEGTARDRNAAQKAFEKACTLFQTEVDAHPGKEVLWLSRRDNACKNAMGTSCVNRIEVPAHRRADLDAQCKRSGLGTVVWSTLSGTDTDECLNAMMNRGCTEIMGKQVYCCPAK